MSVPTKVNFWLDSVGAGRLTCQMTVLLQSPKQNQRIQKKQPIVANVTTHRHLTKKKPHIVPVISGLSYYN